MKFEIKQIIKAVDLGEYAEVYRGKTLRVWVNPPRAVWREYEGVLDENQRRVAEMLGDKTRIEEHAKWAAEIFVPVVHDWYAKMWSQSDNPAEHWSADEIAELSEADPALYEWMQRRSLRELTEFRKAEKKS